MYRQRKPCGYSSTTAASDKSTRIQAPSFVVTVFTAGWHWWHCEGGCTFMCHGLAGLPVFFCRLIVEQGHAVMDRLQLERRTHWAEDRALLRSGHRAQHSPSAAEGPSPKGAPVQNTGASFPAPFGIGTKRQTFAAGCRDLPLSWQLLPIWGPCCKDAFPEENAVTFPFGEGRGGCYKGSCSTTLRPALSKMNVLRLARASTSATSCPTES